MKKNPLSQSGLFDPRVLLAFALCSAGVLLAMFSFTAVTARAPAPQAPSTNLSNGITFEHANLTDPERLVGEPDIYIDHAGGIYVSGPWGTPTQTSWFWKSDDKGTNWHTIGVVPQKSNGQNGGGDTDLAIANNNDVWATDLQSTACMSQFRSTDAGKTFLTGEGCFPLDDRQWLGVYDPNSSATGRRVYLFANNQTLVGVNGAPAPVGCYALVSTDNGVTYQAPNPVGNPSGGIAASHPTCIGRPAVDPANGDLFAPTTAGVFRSTDGATTWNFVGASGAPGGVGNFASIEIDTAGNLYQAWQVGSKTLFSYSTNRGATWHTPIQVSTGPGSPIGTSPGLRQTTFPWMTVGDPGRVAIIFYGTTDTGSVSGFPGSPNALWHAYATFSTNALDANPTFTQVQATEHVMHRGTICTGGFPGCLEANSDRSMADFFMIDKDSQGRAFIAYNENSDLSDVTQGAGQEYIGKPLVAVLRLRTGPSLFAAQGTLLPLPAAANIAITSGSASGGTISLTGTHGLPPGNWNTDPAGDAIFPVVPTAGPNFGAMDILEASASDNGTSLTFKMKLADLSQAATATAASLQPAWMVMWWEGRGGIGPSGVSSGPFHSHWFMEWLGGNQFVFGRVSSTDYATLGAPQPRLMNYIPSTSGTITGNVDTVNGIVTMSVPLANLGGLMPGDKLDHITAYALSDHGGGDPFFPIDQAKTFSYVIGTSAANQHLPDGYVEVSLDNFATSTLATLNSANNTWTASIPSSTGGTVCARQVLAKDLYTPLWDDVQAGPVACVNVGPPVPTSIVSTKVHGTAGTFDINLPLTGTPGIECRQGQGANLNNHLVVVTFPAAVTALGSASASAGSASATFSGNQVSVNLTGVPNAQTISITLHGVTTGGATGDVVIPMGVLLGDVNANRLVNSTDTSLVQAQSGQAVTASNFRMDVNANGLINSTDTSIVRAASGSGLP